MRQTELRPDKDGYYRRNIGFTHRDAGRYVQAKINLGTQKKVAIERLAKITAIWKRIESSAAVLDDKPLWDALSLGIAKAIGSGATEYEVTSIQSDPQGYARFVDAIAHLYPEIRIKPEDEEAYRSGKAIDQDGQAELEQLERSALSYAAEIKAAVLSTSGNDRKYLDLLGDQTLHQALDAYSKFIAQDRFDKSENSINDTGKKKQSFVKQLKSYLADQPLQSLTDFVSVNRLFGVLRSRPISHRYKTPMAAKSVRHLIGELDQFFTKWLHTQPDWNWQLPADYHRISHKPLELETDGHRDAEDIPIYSIEQLKILFEYATPLERLLIALGLNCAFGADQSGRLRIGEIVEHHGRHYVHRVRKKKRVKGVHRLFAITLDGIRWAIQGREDDKDAHVLINGKGNPLWRKTKGGNRSREIPNAWYRLLDRVEIDHPEFPKHGFNILRDTSADMVRQLAGAEIASTHLTHRHQSRDKNLLRYTNVRRKKLFQAHRKLEKRLAPVFIIEGDPWADREHQYVTVKTIKKIRELAAAGVSPTKIANDLKVGAPTVYRWAGNLLASSKQEAMTSSVPS